MSDSRILSVKPIIHYPRVAQVGKTYLMTIDLEVEAGAEWQYEEEEYPIYCTVDSELFSSKPVGEPVVVLHRFGGSYGEAKFLLTAAAAERQGNVKVALINAWGVLVKTIKLEQIQLLLREIPHTIADIEINTTVVAPLPTASEQPMVKSAEIEEEPATTEVAVGYALVVTSLPVEYSAVCRHLIELREETSPQGTIYGRGKFTANGHCWNVCLVEVGVPNAGAAIEVERAIAHFQPGILFFVGIAGGIKDVAIGDVVVATKVYGYESGKVEDQFLTRPEVEKSAYALVQRAKQEARETDWLTRSQISFPRNPNVWLGPIMAGEKVISAKDSAIFRLLKSHYNDAIAVEMEGFGFLKAAFAHPDIKAIVIRGISDLIDRKNDDKIEPEAERQAKAADHASAFAFAMLAKMEPRSTAMEPKFQALIRDKTKDFVGREYVFNRIEAFIKDNPNGYFTIIGDPGMGKSAILAKYVQDTDCIAYFNIHLQGPNRADQFLASVCQQLIIRYELPYGGLPSNTIQDGTILGQLLDEVAEKRDGQSIVIAIDALDEVDSGSYGEANILYLPPYLPEGVYFIMTRRRGVAVPLTTSVPEEICNLLDYQVDSQQDVRLYIQNRVDQSAPLRQQIKARQETIAAFTGKIADRSDNNFTYLRCVLQDIEKGLYQDLSLESFPQGLEGYYRFHWRRMGMTATPLPDAKIKIVYILGEVEQPVSRQQICDFSGEDARTVQPVLDEWEQFLRELLRDEQKRYSVYHSSFRDFLHSQDILEKTGLTIPDVHQMIAKDQLNKWKNRRHHA
jgi:nucleoside phosphorylase